MDRDHPITDERYRRRLAVLQFFTEHEFMDDGWNRDEHHIDIADERCRYLALQYSHSDNGVHWASLGFEPANLVESLSDDEYWYVPHLVIDLDTGFQVLWTRTITITGETPTDAVELLAMMQSDDLETFYDL